MTRHYIRFGSLPEGGRSEHQNWPEPWHDAAAREQADAAVDADEDADWEAVYVQALEALRYEDGVSCYAALCEGTTYRLTGSPHALAYAAELLARRPAYLVTGTEIGVGTDGEPVIADAEIVRSLTAEEITIE